MATNYFTMLFVKYVLCRVMIISFHVCVSVMLKTDAKFLCLVKLILWLKSVFLLSTIQVHVLLFAVGLALG